MPPDLTSYPAGIHCFLPDRAVRLRT